MGKKRNLSDECRAKKRTVMLQNRAHIDEDKRKAGIKAYWERVRNDPELAAKVRAEKSARSKKQWANADKETREEWGNISRNKLKRYHYWKTNPPEDDFWARSNKLAQHRKRVNHTKEKLASIGLDVLPTTTGNVTDEYLDQVDDFFAEVW